jgi:integrase
MHELAWRRIAGRSTRHHRKRRYFTGVNPASNHKFFPVQDRERFIQPDEIGPFFQALAEEPNESMRDAILIALLTGQRRANVLAMRWSEINLDRAEWRLAGELTKNGQPHLVPLSPEAVGILRQRADGRASVFVFPSTRSKTGHLGQPKTAWRRLLDKAQLSDLIVHGLRRTLGSWQARGGASLVMIGKALNHKTPEATAIYARLDLDPVRQSVENATSAMFEAAGVKPKADVIALPAKDVKKVTKRDTNAA